MKSMVTPVAFPDIIKKSLKTSDIGHLHIESELVRLLGGKDPGALNYLYDRYAGALYGIILKAVPDTLTAEKLLTDVFIKIVSDIALFDNSKSRFFTWLTYITNDSIRSFNNKQSGNELAFC